MAQDSYVSAAEADEILKNQTGFEPWFTLDEASKTALLIQSSLMLDSNFDWVGDIATDSQELRWPRKNAYDIDGRLIPDDIIPVQIKRATTFYATNLSSVDLSSNPSNVNKVKVGPIDIQMNSAESIASQLVPKYIVSLLKGLGEYTGPSDQVKAYNVRAYR